ncbi:hypothetical protein ALC53_06660 [Atta colombica]|uniref:DDE Tnp4 domain-containing protein n=1 Tax=Atta colombica TaxID=520822 RepID=A0A195BEF0_9HYME|nr:hypothetical protein ALC53_06660 [Atta colombica]
MESWTKQEFKEHLRLSRANKNNQIGLMFLSLLFHDCNSTTFRQYAQGFFKRIVDSDMRFTNVYCGKSGSLHDARVLRRSTLRSIRFSFLDYPASADLPHANLEPVLSLFHTASMYNKYLILSNYLQYLF